MAGGWGDSFFSGGGFGRGGRGGGRGPVPLSSVPAYGDYGHSGYGGDFVDTESISYKTNSQDPVLMAGRVFVGNLNTQIVSRDKLIKMYLRYGDILGCTCFKGYSFIQFATPDMAHAAIQATNGMIIAGQNLDVKLACESAKGEPMGKMFAGPPAKKQAFNGGGSKPQKRAAPPINDDTPSHEVMTYEAQDTLVCGNCDKVFHEWTQFRDHRKEPCSLATNNGTSAKKPDGEPDVVICFVCKEKFGGSWPLLQHLSTTHNLTVYIDENNPEPEGKNNLEDFIKKQ